MDDVLVNNIKYICQNNGGFGLKVKKEPENVKNLYAEGKSKKTLVKGGIVAAAIVVASVASLIGFGVTGNMYSLTGSYTGSGRIDIKTTDETYLDKKSFIEDLIKKAGILNIQMLLSIVLKEQMNMMKLITQLIFQSLLKSL